MGIWTRIDDESYSHIDRCITPSVGGDCRLKELKCSSARSRCISKDVQPCVAYIVPNSRSCCQEHHPHQVSNKRTQRGLPIAI